MSDLNYAYAVARIRVLEKYLLSDSDIEEGLKRIKRFVDALA